MKIKFWKYDWEDAKRIAMFLEALGYTTEIIGSLKTKRHSNNDIDIYLPATEYSEEVAYKIRKYFWVRDAWEITDWGSLYLHSTPFGTLDIFFKGQTEEFDY